MKPSLQITAKPELRHQLMVMEEMQQGLRLLQLPIMELKAAIDEEIQDNPLLESQEKEDVSLSEEAYRDTLEEKEFHEPMSDDEKKKRAWYETLIEDKKSLFTNLMDEMEECLPEIRDRKIGEAIAGSLNESGYLDATGDELTALTGASDADVERVLSLMQHFFPTGIAARTLQERLLLQLEMKGLKESDAYRMLGSCFSYFLHKDIKNLKKNLQLSDREIREAYRVISKLNLHPENELTNDAKSTTAVPDIVIREENGQLITEVNEGPLPEIRITESYEHLGEETGEVKDYYEKKMKRAKWFFRNLELRQHLLKNMAEFLIQSQKKFFLFPDGKLEPMTMKKVAGELGVHESTITRAVRDKTLNSPRGTFPLRHFFSVASEKVNGETISAQTIKDLLAELIQQENPKKPLSDEDLVQMLRQRGMKAARRTVAKYRGELRIGNAHERKKLS